MDFRPGRSATRSGRTVGCKMMVCRRPVTSEANRRQRRKERRRHRERARADEMPLQTLPAVNKCRQKRSVRGGVRVTRPQVGPWLRPLVGVGGSSLTSHQSSASVKEESPSWQLIERVAEWPSRSGVGSLGDLSDQSTCGPAPPASVAVENHWCATDAVLMGSVGVSWKVLLSVSYTVRMWVVAVTQRGVLEAGRSKS